MTLPHEITEAVDAIKEVYRFESGGGYLHGIIDDGNVDCLPDDEEIDAAISHKTGRRYPFKTRERYKRCVNALWKLTCDGREFACHLAHGHDANEWVWEHIQHIGECPHCSEFDVSDLVT